MNDSKRNTAPWDEGYYQTGAVPGPRRHGGLVMVLLVAVVLLGGIITILGVLNIHLFVALKKQENALALKSPGSMDTQPSLAGEDPGFSMDLNTQPEDQTTELPTPQQIYADCIDSVVSVSCDGAEGTGLVVDGDGYIITNLHILEETKQIRVRLSDDRQYTATVVGTDATSDLAVLRIDAKGLTAVTFGDSQELQVGDSVCAIGDPFGSQHHGTMTNGTVSTLEEGELPLIHTDALNYPGGPLLNQYGHVIGIGVKLDGTVVIPSTAVKTIVEQLVCQGYVTGRPVLGIQCEPVSQRHQYYYDLPAGLYVTEVITQIAGKTVCSGDILISLDSLPLTTCQELASRLCGYQVGDQVSLTLLRDGQELTITVTIEEAGS